MKTNILSLRKTIFLSIFLLSILISGITQTTRTTKNDGLWSDPNTWTGDVIPDASNKATINNDVIIDMDVNILSLTISASSSLTFDTISAHVFTVADEVVVNGLFTVARNKVSPLKHIVEVGADFYGPGDVDFYDRSGDVAELVFIGNSNSILKDVGDLTGTGGNGKFGGLKVEKTVKNAVVTLKKDLDINSGTSPSVQSSVTVVKGILDLDSSYISGGDNTNILQVDSLGQLHIASLNPHSCNGFEQYVIHPSSTVKYYNGTDYEMTKGWDAFNGEFGNFIVSGDGIKYFGDSVVTRNIRGNFTIDAGANYNLDNDSIIINDLVSVNGTFSSNNKPGYIIFDSLVAVSDNGAWEADMNDIFEFRNGLSISKKADFSSGTSNYIFTTNDQEIFLQDTIQNIEINTVHLINTDSLACITLTGNGTLVNNYSLNFLGASITCNLGLDSANNMVIYSNENPEIKTSVYENLRFEGTGTGNLGGDVTIKKSLVKDNDGYISIGNHNLTIDTTAVFQIENPDSTRMIVTDGTGSLIIKSTTAGDFTRVYPVGTLTDSTVYTPFEITNTINHPGGVKYISVRSTYGFHPGMEDATGLKKYWKIGTDMLPTDSIEADIRFAYSENEVNGNES
ncbi:MAG: hypothetical protein JXB49_07870, partial [Bacteroidales bacterium]|nr:hypothetical protein [Bacteroidales bacterium]